MSAPATRAPGCRRSVRPGIALTNGAPHAKSAAKRVAPVQDDRRRSRRPLAGGARRRHHLRHPRRAEASVYDPLYDSKVRHVPGPPRAGRRPRGQRLRPCQRPRRRHDGHLRPGATNLVTPLADAQMDSIPVAAILLFFRHRRPGAVLVDIPKDVLQLQCTFSWPPTELPGYKSKHPSARPPDQGSRQADHRRCCQTRVWKFAL